MELWQIARASASPTTSSRCASTACRSSRPTAPQKHDYEGVGEVLVLDRSVTRVYPDGSQRHIIHTIAELRSKEAIDRYGEIRPGRGHPGAHAAQHQARRPRVRAGVDPREGRPQPARPADRRHRRVRVHVRAPELGLLPGYVDLSTFRFQSQETPFHISEMIVAHPRAWPSRPSPRRRPAGGREHPAGRLVTSHWKVDRSPRLGVEPQMRNSLFEVPSVRVYTDVDTEAGCPRSACACTPASAATSSCAS
jgi:hypothetical protein